MGQGNYFCINEIVTFGGFTMWPSGIYVGGQ